MDKKFTWKKFFDEAITYFGLGIAVAVIIVFLAS